MKMVIVNHDHHNIKNLSEGLIVLLPSLTFH